MSFNPNQSKFVNQKHCALHTAPGGWQKSSALFLSVLSIKPLNVCNFKNSQLPQNLSVQFVCPNPKVLDFNEKRLHGASVVREPNYGCGISACKFGTKLQKGFFKPVTLTWHNFAMFVFLVNWLILEARAEIQKNLLFLGQMKTLKFASEIYWPLITCMHLNVTYWPMS